MKSNDIKSAGKSVVLIVEDNLHKAFTTRQLLELKLKLEVNMVSCGSEREVADQAVAIDPDYMFFRPSGTVSELVLQLKKRHMNRRNTIVVLIHVDELEDNFARKMREFATGYTKTAAVAAAA